jgi:hypothetical protein
MNNPLTKPPFNQPAVQITPPCELTPAQVRRVHVLHLRLKSKRKALAFVEAQIEGIIRSYSSH